MKQKWLIFGIVFLFVLLFVNFLDASVVYETKEVLGEEVLQVPIWSIDYLKNPKDLVVFSFSWIRFHSENFLGLTRFNNVIDALNQKVGSEVYSLGGFVLFFLLLVLFIGSLFLVFSKKKPERKIIYSVITILGFGFLFFYFGFFGYFRALINLAFFTSESWLDFLFLFLVWFWIFVFYFFLRKINIEDLITDDERENLNRLKNNAAYRAYNNYLQVIQNGIKTRSTQSNFFKIKLKSAFKNSFYLFLFFAIPFIILKFIPFLSGVVEIITFGKLFYGSFWKLLVRSFVVSVLLVFFPLIFSLYKNRVNAEENFEEALKEEASEIIDKFQKGL